MNSTVAVSRFVVVALSLMLMGTGCASLESKMPIYDHALSNGPMGQGQSRVCLARRSGMLGAMVTHYAVDAGNNTAYDARLIRRQDVHAEPLSKAVDGRIGYPVRITPTDPLFSNRGVRASVACVCLPNWKSPGRQLFVTSPASDNEVVKKRDERIWWDDSRGLFGQRLGSSFLDITPVVAGLPANCRYLGEMGNGEYIAFDRKPGTMRLRVVTEGGDECFAPDFTIEAGKKYIVDYQYGASGPTFIIHERPQ